MYGFFDDAVRALLAAKKQHALQLMRRAHAWERPISHLQIASGP
jgi:hypothetical protein